MFFIFVQVLIVAEATVNSSLIPRKLAQTESEIHAGDQQYRSVDLPAGDGGMEQATSLDG